MFIRYMSFDMRTHNKKPLNYTKLNILKYFFKFGFNQSSFILLSIIFTVHTFNMLLMLRCQMRITFGGKDLESKQRTEKH